MRRVERRRARGRTKAAEKAEIAEQLMVLILGAIALLGFLIT